MTMLDKIKEAAKSVGTLLSGIIVAVLAIGIDDPNWARGLAIAAAVVGAIVVWATPNKETDAQRLIREAGEQALDTRTYKEVGGGEYPERTDVLAEDHTSFPEAGTLYEPGEKEGERFGASLPVSGNENYPQTDNPHKRLPEFPA